MTLDSYRFVDSDSIRFYGRHTEDSPRLMASGGPIYKISPEKYGFSKGVAVGSVGGKHLQYEQTFIHLSYGPSAYPVNDPKLPYKDASALVREDSSPKSDKNWASYSASSGNKTGNYAKAA